MNTKFCSRRAFLKDAGISLGAAALAAAGSGCTAQPAQAKVETPSYVYGEENMNRSKILVAYATRAGSTTGVAAAIGETIARRGFAVDVKPIEENPTPDDYAVVVLGSAIQGAQWLPEAVAYVKQHQKALNKVQVALFCVHIMNLGNDERSEKNRLAYLEAVRPLVHPVDEGFFAGVGMNPDETPGIVRWVYRTFKIGGEGDCRDWGKIRGWADGVPLKEFTLVNIDIDDPLPLC